MKRTNSKTTVIFDGLCSICCRFKRFVENRSDRFEFIPYQEIDFEKEFRNIGLENTKHAVQLVTRSGKTFSAGKAVGEILKRISLFWKIVGVIITLPVVIYLTESCYRAVADHRDTIASFLGLPPQKTICN